MFQFQLFLFVLVLAVIGGSNALPAEATNENGENAALLPLLVKDVDSLLEDTVTALLAKPDPKSQIKVVTLGEFILGLSTGGSNALPAEATIENGESENVPLVPLLVKDVDGLLNDTVTALLGKPDEKPQIEFVSLGEMILGNMRRPNA